MTGASKCSIDWPSCKVPFRPGRFASEPWVEGAATETHDGVNPWNSKTSVSDGWGCPSQPRIRLAAHGCQSGLAAGMPFVSRTLPTRRHDIIASSIGPRIAVVRRRHQESLALEMDVPAPAEIFDVVVVALGRPERLVILIKNDRRFLIVLVGVFEFAQSVSPHNVEEAFRK
jgi:hypothetical protein